jgi:Zn-dependent membrane protease YugP
MLGMLLIPVGFMMASLALIKIGLILFATMVFFSLVTLPVEFDASRRAMNELERMGLAGGDDWTAARKVLNAAALTYVASTIQLVLQLLYFAWRAGLIGGGRSDDRAEA